MNRFNQILTASLLAIFAWACTSTACEECLKKIQGIIIIDTVDTALVSNANVVIINKGTEVILQDVEQVRATGVKKSIIIDTVDTARVESTQKPHHLDQVASSVIRKVKEADKK